MVAVVERNQIYHLRTDDSKSLIVASMKLTVSPFEAERFVREGLK